MKNVSKLNINLLMEQLYIDSMVNRIYEESSDFDWIRDTQPIDLTFDGDHEFWVDLEGLYDDEKVRVTKYLTKYTNSNGERTIRSVLRDPRIFLGIVLHCGDEDHDYEPIEGDICTMVSTFSDDENSDNSIYVNGKDLLSQIPSTMTESEDKGEKKSIKDDIVNDLNLSRSFVFTFGTGIGALMEPVTKLLEGGGVHMTSYQVSLLIITAIAIMLNEANTKDAINKLKEEGIYKYLQGVINFITNTKELVNTITKNITNTTHGLADILGFTFILVPSMNVLSELIVDNGLTLSTLGQFLTGVTAGAATYGVKSIMKKIKSKL